MVAIVTTMILMIVISIIVLGFSQVVRRNQRQVLDRQLSSQAFYAAESGINLARKKLSQPGGSAFRSNTCDGGGTPTEYQLGSDNTAAITCLLVQPVDTLKFDKITTTSKVSLIQPENNGIPTDIYINWESSTPGNVSASCTIANANNKTLLRADPAAPAAERWTCNQPMLRIDLVPLESGSTSMDRGALAASQFTAFLYPKRDAITISSFAWGGATGNLKGSVIPVNCSDSLGNDPNKKRKCTLRLTALPAKNRFAIRMMSIYGEANTDIHVGGSPLLEGAQMVVDSTGRAADVLKRVQARIPINGGPGIQIPSFAVDTAGPLCKRYQVMSNNTIYGSSPAGCQLP